MSRLLAGFFAALSTLLSLSACSESGSSSGSPGSAPECQAITGNPWVPQAGNASLHDASTQVSVQSFRGTAPLRGLSESPAFVDVPFSIPTDLGDGGSISLIAQIENFPSSLRGGAHPLLVSLRDGQNEFISLKPTGHAGCGGGGYFCCSVAQCDLNALWNVEGPAAYGDISLWETHQVSPFGYLSVNTFPNCRWNDSEVPTDSRTHCYFGDETRFPGGKLRPGANYLARYALVLSDYDKNPVPLATATLSVTLLKKSKPRLDSGALDLNVVLVGTKNIQDSRTPQGARNLDALLGMIQSRYSRSGASGISLGRVQVYEWTCSQGGEAFAQIKIDDLGSLFSQGSSLLASGDNGHALNLFMVSNLLSPDSSITLLGVSGGIGGPLVSGTVQSGLAFASFGKLAAYGPDAPELRELGETISHEMGHFLGLSHPSEADGAHHDPVPDTPICTHVDPLAGIRMITHRSCRDLEDTPSPGFSKTCLQACPSYDGKTQFCPDAAECQFNHLMWWTVKNWSGTNGDGSLISAQSDRVIRFSPAIQ